MGNLSRKPKGKNGSRASTSSSTDTKNAIVSFLFRYVKDCRTAENLAQETFLRGFKKIQEYNSTAKDEFKRRVRHPANRGMGLPAAETTGTIERASVTEVQ